MTTIVSSWNLANDRMLAFVHEVVVDLVREDVEPVVLRDVAQRLTASLEKTVPVGFDGC